MLNVENLSIPSVEKGSREYKPDPIRECIIDIEAENGVFRKDDLYNLFDYEWRSRYKSAIYGRSIEDKKWTFALAGDSPETYDKVQVAINLLEVFNEENPDYNPHKIERYIVELEKRMKDYPYKLEIDTKKFVSKSIEQAKRWVELYREINCDVVIILQSNNLFNGKDVWNTLLSIGLDWGNSDLFHWSNYTSGYGDQVFFTVWTTTKPGCFLPDSIEEGEMNPQDLLFGFSIPRSADPENIFKEMYSAVRYCQERLGGVLLDRNRQLFDERKEQEKLLEKVLVMKTEGINPGSDVALRMF